MGATVHPGAGDDTVIGGPGLDVLRGGKGRDFLVGDRAQPYNDELYGGAGYDYCGAGSIRIGCETDNDYTFDNPTQG